MKAEIHPKVYDAPGHLRFLWKNVGNHFHQKGIAH